MKEDIVLPKDLMKIDMEKLPFVNWDRFIVNTKDNKIDLYGWIKRKDKHEDFVILTYEYKGDSVWDAFYSTSSKKYDKEIFKLLECGGDEPFECQRVEEFFEIKNVVKLDGK